MNRTTTNDLILFLFNETEMTETVCIQNSIDSDYFVNEEFEELKESFNLLDALMFEPNNSTIESVMSYSALTAPLQVH